MWYTDIHSNSNGINCVACSRKAYPSMLACIASLNFNPFLVCVYSWLPS